jgi:hypothetical protein
MSLGQPKRSLWSIASLHQGYLCRKLVIYDSQNLVLELVVTGHLPDYREGKTFWRGELDVIFHTLELHGYLLRRTLSDRAHSP